MIEQRFNLRISVRASTSNEAHVRAAHLADVVRGLLEVAGANDIEVLPGVESAGIPVDVKAGA
jgi:hypothetical protein